jgi:predicted GH43/DUF377 family glycosyl hydrolase
VKTPFELKRLGQVMEPEPGNPMEIEGVLNPAAMRGPDGQLYLFPRLVARNNYSRIGIARVKFNREGDPCGVERLGIALEPEADYERWPDGRGGCEDPRITYVERLQRYVMTYTGHSPQGPRIAMAVSADLFHWKRLGLATFEPYRGIDFVNVDNKDSSVFPVAIPNHRGKMQMAILHRPLFRGTPPILTRHGWLMIYHGVQELPHAVPGAHPLCYSAGVMVLSQEHPRTILYRSEEPVLTPLLNEERHGTVSNVVFPTGIDRRDDIGQPDRIDVYYGMADSRIGVAHLDVPEFLPSGAPADGDGPKTGGER